jgi:outer membrane protein OmpA-like peptidoglycan-associated protein
VLLVGAAGFLVWKFVINKGDDSGGGSGGSAGPTKVVDKDGTGGGGGGTGGGGNGGGGANPTWDPSKHPAGKGVIRVAGDPWSGYSTFRGEPKLAAELQRSNIKIDYVDPEDGHPLWDQDARMNALAKGEIDVAVTTVDAFLQHGAKHLVGGQYPGVILWNIDESAGGDAIFVAKGKKNFDDVTANDTVCFSVGTPSEHLWDFASLSFSHLENLKTDLKTDKNEDVTNAKDCYEKLKAGKIQVAVLWQPYTALAQKDGYTKVFATGVQADDVIVDIVVANRDFVKKESATLATLAKAYFKTIDGYKKDPAAHAKVITEDCGPDCGNDINLGKSVLSGIDFLSYEDNMQLWWGRGKQEGKMATRIEKTGKLLRLKNKLDKIPDAGSVLDRQFLDKMDKASIDTSQPVAVVVDPNDPTKKKCDTAKRNDRSADVGTLKLPSIYFGSGSHDLDPNGKAIVAGIATQLESFPHQCVRLYGYTSSEGDKSYNKQLSEKRAKAIAKELQAIRAGVYPDACLDVRGFGPENLIKKGGAEDAEASRRTEFTLYNCDTR